MQKKDLAHLCTELLPFEQVFLPSIGFNCVDQGVAADYLECLIRSSRRYREARRID